MLQGLPGEVAWDPERAALVRKRAGTCGGCADAMDRAADERAVTRHDLSVGLDLREIFDAF